MFEIPHPQLLTAAQMQALEAQMFGAGIPVAALMEKVSLRASEWIRARYPHIRRLGILLGTGHNGGDGLVIGRELRLTGSDIKVWQGPGSLKTLTAAHADYLRHLGGSWVAGVEELADCDVLVDGLFGIGLSRELGDPWAEAVQWANESGIPIVSLDVPSGLSADQGIPWGSVCIKADLTLCLGLWKRGLWQDAALDWIGDLEGVDFGVPPFALQGLDPGIPQLLTPEVAQVGIPRFSPRTHKYKQGHLLLIAGSTRYGGAAVLAALGSRGSGAGLVTVVVPESLGSLLLQWAPEVIVRRCPETETGEIASLAGLEWERYQAVAFGPGLGQGSERLLGDLQAGLLGTGIPCVIDADGLNGLARWGWDRWGSLARQTVITPHEGEFRRLYPVVDLQDRLAAAARVVQGDPLTLVLKGSRTVIATPEGTWVNPRSTPALARGGSGDVLTGLIGGLLAQGSPPWQAALTGVWWHSQAACLLAHERGMTGVDPVALAGALPRLCSGDHGEDQGVWGSP